LQNVLNPNVYNSSMETNFVGLASAAATFLGVWIGHVSVRKIERQVERIWIPAAIVLILGIGLELASFRADNLIVSTICGILGFTLLWDSLELAHRQPRRVMKGHAPANPRNPRHARILAEYPDATTIDWLARDPRGVPFSEEEIRAIRGQTK
jgi:hypothetical protein